MNVIRHIPTDKTVLQKWLKAGYIENRILFPTQAGTPQGGIISPTLANMTLAIEEEHARILGESPGNHRREQVCEPKGAGETVESGHSWLGQLSSAYRGQGYVPPG